MSVSFVAASGTTYTTATSQNQTIPTVSVGDLLIAVVMHRATLTAASGWTLVASQSCTGGGFTQYTSVYKRVAQSGDSGSSTTWTQASSQRIAVHIVAFTSSSGCDVVDFDTASQNNITSSSNVGVMAVSTATDNGQMGVAFASCPIVAVSPSAANITASGSFVLTTPASVADNRLAAAYLSRNTPETTTGTFTSNILGSNSNGWACVSLIVGERSGFVADQIIPAFGQTAAAIVEVAVTGAQAVPAFGQSVALTTGTIASAIANQTVPGFGQAATGTVEIAATASQAIAAFTQSAIVVLDTPRESSAIQAIPAFGQSVSLTVECIITVAQTIPAFGQFAVLRRGDVTPGLLFRGVIGNCSINRAGLATLEARSILTLGRGFLSERFCAACRADLYDARCKVSKDSFSAGATVASVLGQFKFTVTSLPDGRAVNGWYDLGQAVITSGDGEGTPFQIKAWTQASLTVETMTPIDDLLDAGDTLTLYAGCDKSSTTCRDKFSNIINYRGEEYAAGRDLQLTTTAS